MSFILRRIAITKTGKQIVRDSALDGATILLGRDSANAIHVADLAVNPHHATISSADGRMVRVEAQEGLGFELNGRALDVADIDSAAGAELRFGGHRLTIAREDEKIILLVERIDELSEASRDVEEAKAFSLSGLMPGRRLGAWLFAALMVLAFLVGPIWAWQTFRQVDERPEGYHADTAWLSGDLSSAHASLKNDCQSCHVDAFVAVTDQACVSCHTGEHKAMSNAHAGASKAMLLAARGEAGFGEALLRGIGESFNRPQGRCVDCHTEHEGAGAMPATPQKFCADCHDGMQGRLKLAGHASSLGDAADFGTSHPEFRPLARTAAGAKLERLILTDKSVDVNGLKFPHDVHLAGNGGVARMAASFRGRYDFGSKLECKNCHTPEADGVGLKPVNMQRDCAMCHSLSFETVGGVTRTLRHGEPDQVVADLTAYYRSTPPSRPLQLGGMERRRPGQYAEGQLYNIYFREVAVRPNRAADAVRAVFSEGGACYDCHTIYAPTAGKSWRVEPVRQTPRFMEKGWFDHDSHKETACADCHVSAPKSKKADDLLMPAVAQCRTCHVGEAGGSLVKVRQETKSSCAMCHEYHDDGSKPWKPAQDRMKSRAQETADVSAITKTLAEPVYAGAKGASSDVRHVYRVTWRVPTLREQMVGG
jgi:hypothetical protein